MFFVGSSFLPPPPSSLVLEQATHSLVLGQHLSLFCIHFLVISSGCRAINATSVLKFLSLAPTSGPSFILIFLTTYYRRSKSSSPEPGCLLYFHAWCGSNAEKELTAASCCLSCQVGASEPPQCGCPLCVLVLFDGLDVDAQDCTLCPFPQLSMPSPIPIAAGRRSPVFYTCLSAIPDLQHLSGCFLLTQSTCHSVKPLPASPNSWERSMRVGSSIWEGRSCC